jgi:hypothetical protein
MKTIRWTPHAKQEATRREISANEAEKTITHPDSVAPARLPRMIFMRRYFDSVLQAEMLLRVVAEETETEWVIVTLYKTSKFKKYEGEQKQ